jgi:hypothetical protein
MCNRTLTISHTHTCYYSSHSPILQTPVSTILLLQDALKGKVMCTQMQVSLFLRPKCLICQETAINMSSYSLCIVSFGFTMAGRQQQWCIVLIQQLLIQCNGVSLGGMTVD